MTAGVLDAADGVSTEILYLRDVRFGSGPKRGKGDGELDWI